MTARLLCCHRPVYDCHRNFLYDKWLISRWLYVIYAFIFCKLFLGGFFGVFKIHIVIFFSVYCPVFICPALTGASAAEGAGEAPGTQYFF